MVIHVNNNVSTIQQTFSRFLICNRVIMYTNGRTKRNFKAINQMFPEKSKNGSHFILRSDLNLTEF